MTSPSTFSPADTERFKEMLAILNWSKADLAEQFDYSEYQVTRWLGGATIPKLVLMHMELLVKLQALSLDFKAVKVSAK